MVERSIAHYQILDEIGRGGMGIVYKARDTRLDRDAAIKALPEDLAEDPERLARFEREAKLLASLNNPHIATLYGLEEVEGRRFLAMELVEGENLAERISKGPIPVQKAMELAHQIAEALEAAHEAGVIHRDVKPGNIMIGEDGKAKVLDFGLAKDLQTNVSETGLSLSPTLPQPMTQSGQILGTPVYMSPEQAEGKEASRQSDIWAFGCVLYEMLAGKRAFPGMISSDTEIEPDWEALPTATPMAVRRLLRRCLAKNQLERLRDIGDATLDLTDARSWDPEVHPESTARPATLRRWLQPAAVLAVGLALGAILVSSFDRPAETTAIAPRPALRGVVELPEGAGLAYGAALIGFDSPMLALSPDGRWLVYVGQDGTGSRLYRHDLTRYEPPQPISGTEGALYSFFAPDGSAVGFATEGRLKRVSLDGEDLRTLAEVRSVTRASWLADGSIVFGENEGGRIVQVPADGGAKKELLTLYDGYGRMSDVLPEGRRILATSTNRGISADYADIQLVDLQTREVTVLIERGYDARYLPSGHIVFGRAGNLMAMAFDLKSGKVSGAPVTVVPDVAMDSLFTQNQVAIAANGTLGFAPGGERTLGRIAWLDRAGNEGQLAAKPRLYGVLDLDPDDRRLAIHVGDVTDFVWIFDLDRSEGRILHQARPGGWPSWSSSGLSLAYSRRGASGQTVVLTEVDASTESAGLSTFETAGATPGGWAPDDRSLVIYSFRRERLGVGAIGSGEIGEWIPGWSGVFSPDGKWLAYVGHETGVFEIYVRSWPKGDVVRQISTAGGIEPRWCPCGELFYRAGDTFWSVEIQTEPELAWQPPKLAFETDFIDTPGISFDISSDGNRLYVVKQAKPDIKDRIHVVANWSDEVSRLVSEGN
jgi:Tol biopolymer transport system component/tRNA A-37 threonylcarbamoyl transferase component Bud32